MGSMYASSCTQGSLHFSFFFPSCCSPWICQEKQPKQEWSCQLDPVLSAAATVSLEWSPFFLFSFSIFLGGVARCGGGGWKRDEKGRWGGGKTHLPVRGVLFQGPFNMSSN
ncbi:uncharacterized protein BP01DRAFT_148659 [Aspergillus saccharolyticus JOP 1030-1]|uniref:Uncharacterized protein n=1 Tax=Aspergillus saccharolyticus JOP 1030-1 TaxID=1450539 RepID=A0A318ZWJ0_9EURO|nr:hypothetical protein BP01DRAFT_148659 [Aspergillus saccharolyticus JOP 1030-1]PYH48460.1 hypothetical protein BP01DRAFT_148659 [Aspergillus saccharolyticus JOP 1030-1]